LDYEVIVAMTGVISITMAGLVSVLGAKVTSVYPTLNSLENTGCIAILNTMFFQLEKSLSILSGPIATVYRKGKEREYGCHLIISFPLSLKGSSFLDSSYRINNLFFF
jgi:hypothetical protein